MLVLNMRAVVKFKQFVLTLAQLPLVLRTVSST